MKSFPQYYSKFPFLNHTWFNHRQAGSAGLLIGIILLLSAQDFITYEVAGKLFVPIILIALGLKLIVKSAKPEQATVNTDNNEEKRESEE